jgi:hypothetical protein
MTFETVGFHGAGVSTLSHQGSVNRSRITDIRHGPRSTRLSALPLANRAGVIPHHRQGRDGLECQVLPLNIFDVIESESPGKMIDVCPMLS